MKKILGNTPEIPESDKEALKFAIGKALILAYEEKYAMDQIENSRYTEEHLRYTVMASISELKRFGRFPNTLNSDHHLAFQFDYKYYPDEEEIYQLKPDIVSLKCTHSNKYSWNNPLVIELKINGKNTDKNHSRIKDFRTRIKKLGACIESDILKTRIYLTKVRDSHTFEFGVVINLTTDKEVDLKNLEKMLERQRKEIKNPKYDSHKNLLFAWYNPNTEKPELIWLNQTNEIKLGRVK